MVREVWEKSSLGYSMYLGWAYNGSAIVVASVTASIVSNGELEHVDGLLAVYNLRDS
jgi:hypothetical protein